MRYGKRVQWRRLRRLAVVAIGLGVSAAAAPGAELQVGYRAIERLLEHRLFKEDGRHYLQGAPGDECRSYLEDPEVSRYGDRLKIRMRFDGMVGMEIAGRCRGLGDAFHASLTGRPVYEEGEIRLADVEVETEGRGYGNLLRPFLTVVLPRALSFPLVERINEASTELREQMGLQLDVPRLEVQPIRLMATGLVVPLELTVKINALASPAG